MDEATVTRIGSVRGAILHVLRRDVEVRPVLGNWRALLDYLHADMSRSPVERVRVLHLNARNELLRDDVVSEGTIDGASLHVREVMRRALDLGSTSLILVHNHPSGHPAPSARDIAATRALATAGSALGIELHDHLVISARGHVSFRAQHLL